MTMSPDSPTMPSPTTDVADWLGIEVLPTQGNDPVSCTTRIRQLGRSGPWKSRDGTAQELRLFRAIVGLVRSAPVEGRDLVLDVAELTRALQYTPAAPVEVYRSIGQRQEMAERLKRERDDARAAASVSNEDLVAVITGFRRLRAAPEHQRNTPASHRQEGELNALDYILRLLRGEEALTPQPGDPR